MIFFTLIRTFTDMGRWKKGQIGKKKTKKRIRPVSHMESMMGKDQHAVYAEILTGQPARQPSPNLTPPAARLLRPLYTFKHPRRKLCKINYDLTKACKTAYYKVFARHGISTGDALLASTTLELARGARFRVTFQRLLNKQTDIPESVPQGAEEQAILFKLIKAMDVHGISASKVNEMRQILAKGAIPSSDKIRAGIATLNTQIKENLGLYSGPKHAGVDPRKTVTWLIENGLIPDERRIGLLWSGDGRQTGRKMQSVQIGVCMTMTMTATMNTP